MAVNKDQVRDLLGTGLSTEIVASAVGCDPSYVTQLMAHEEFAISVVALRTKHLTENNVRDGEINEIEDDLIEKLKDLIATDQIYKPNDILRAFSVINNAKRRGVTAASSVVVNQTIVNLQIPAKVVQSFTMNQQGEVIEVEGQTLVTMPAHTLLKNLSENRKDAKGEVYEKISRYLPATINEADTADSGS